MATVVLEIGEHRWPVACRDGEEPQLERLGAMIAERWPDAQRAAGNAGTQQALLLAALMLADDLVDAAKPVPAADASDALVAIAARLETLAATLEKDGAKA